MIQIEQGWFFRSIYLDEWNWLCIGQERSERLHIADQLFAQMMGLA